MYSNQELDINYDFMNQLFNQKVGVLTGKYQLFTRHIIVDLLRVFNVLFGYQQQWHHKIFFVESVK